MSAPELKPCPFCGPQTRWEQQPDVFEAVSLINKGYLQCVVVQCPICAIEFSEDTEAEAITAWNTRSDLATKAVKVAGIIPNLISACVEQHETATSAEMQHYYLGRIDAFEFALKALTEQDT